MFCHILIFEMWIFMSSEVIINVQTMKVLKYLTLFEMKLGYLEVSVHKLNSGKDEFFHDNPTFLLLNFKVKKGLK